MNTQRVAMDPGYPHRADIGLGAGRLQNTPLLQNAMLLPCYGLTFIPAFAARAFWRVSKV